MDLHFKLRWIELKNVPNSNLNTVIRKWFYSLWFWAAQAGLGPAAALVLVSTCSSARRAAGWSSWVRWTGWSWCSRSECRSWCIGSRGEAGRTRWRRSGRPGGRGQDGQWNQQDDVITWSTLFATIDELYYVALVLFLMSVSTLLLWEDWDEDTASTSPKVSITAEEVAIFVASCVFEKVTRDQKSRKVAKLATLQDSNLSRGPGIKKNTLAWLKNNSLSPGPQHHHSSVNIQFKHKH